MDQTNESKEDNTMLHQASFQQAHEKVMLHLASFQQGHEKTLLHQASIQQDMKRLCFTKLVSTRR